MRMWIFLPLLGGCISSEVAVSRQGLVSGTAKQGGVGLEATSTVFRETGHDNLAGGLDIAMLDESQSEGLVSTLGATVRYARQLTTSPRWRGFGRASLGINGCRIVDCKDPALASRHRHLYDVELGVERMFFVHGPENAGFLSADLGVIYTRSSDQMLGEGNFVGLALGLHVGTNLMSKP